MIAPNEEFEFCVKHVEPDGQRLKFWVQTDDYLAQSINSKLLELKNFLSIPLHEHIRASNQHNIRPKQIIYVKLQNNFYYRAKVIEIFADNVSVHLIDLGHCTFVTFSQICVTESFPDEGYLASLPEAVTDFILANIEPIGGIWSQDKLQLISRIFSSGEKFNGFYEIINNVKHLRFQILGCDFAVLLANRGLATYSNIPKIIQQPIQIRPGLRLPQQQVLPVIAPVAQTVPAQRNMQNSAKTKDSNCFKCIVFDIGSKHKVLVSYVSNGPNTFMVQRLESRNKLRNMMAEINAISHVPLKEPPYAGMVCIGKNITDHKYYRIVLNSPGEKTCKVHFIDYGYDQVLNYSSIFQIEDRFREDNMFYIRFTLSGIINWKITEELKDYFSGLVHDVDLELTVCEGPESPLIQYCHLYKDGINIKDILKENFPEAYQLKYIEPKPLMKDRREIVQVTYSENIGKFYVQIESEAKKLDDLKDKIYNAANNCSYLNSSKIIMNMPCLALYPEDELWYRASIIGIVNDDKVRVLYVDYGNEEVVKIQLLRIIPMELVTALPKQAIRCCLTGFQQSEITSEINKFFDYLVDSKSLSMTVLESTAEKLVVDMIEADNSLIPNSKTIVQKLKDRFNKSPQQRNQIPKWNDGRNRYDNDSSGNIKYNKDNFNEQRQDRRFQKDFAEPYNNSQNRYNKNVPRNDQSYNKSSGFQNDRFPKTDFKNNESYDGRFNRVNQNNRDWNTNNRQNFSNRDEDEPTRQSGGYQNHSRIGTWQKGDQDHDSFHKKYNGDNNNSAFNKSKSPRAITNNTSLDKSSIDCWDDSSTSLSTSIMKETTRSKTSTPIFEVSLPKILAGSIKNCELVYYVNPSDFYIQLCPDNDDIKEMNETLKTYYDAGGKILLKSDLKINQLCVAQYSEDLNWYRSIVKSLDEYEATVFFIDYGNTEVVNYNKIKEIDPKYSKMPAQAIHCQLYCPTKAAWTDEESDAVVNKLEESKLEVEFIKEENGLYQILLKIIQDNNSQSFYINNLYEIKSNQNVSTGEIYNEITKLDSEIEYAEFTDKWLVKEITLGEKDINVVYFENPEKFFCHLISEEDQFRNVMEEIQEVYLNRQPVKKALQVGSSVIAIFPSDDNFYRATILQCIEAKTYLVLFVDYGNDYVVEESCIFPVEKKYMELPIQSILCSLKGIGPIDGSTYSNLTSINEIFCTAVKCTIYEKVNDKYIVSLRDDTNDISDILVNKKLAVRLGKNDVMTENIIDSTIQPSSGIQKINLSLLEGQTIRVKISNVESVSDFYAQLETANLCEDIINSYMSNSDNKLMQLPSQLSMQKQALKCCVFQTYQSATVNDLLKKLISGKEVLIYVEKVDGERLFTRLFDLNGSSIKLNNNSIVQEIIPIPSMPIWGSDNEVIITWINHAGSVWLQKTSNFEIEQDLLENLQSYYSSKVFEEDLIIEIGKIYAALSSDGNWYRVKIISIQDDNVKTIFIDYGNLENIPVKNLRRLDSSFFLPHQLAIEVSLPVTMSQTSEAQLDILQPLVDGKNFISTLYNINKKWIAELTDNNEKLSEILLKMGVAKKIPETQLEFKNLPNMAVNEKHSIILSHFIDPQQFWVQRTEELDTIKKLQSELQSSVTSFNDVTDVLQKNSKCLAKNSIDEMWYRAQVIDSDTDITNVEFIDFGGIDAITSTCLLKEIPCHLKDLKKYATLCKLNIDPALGDWSEDACIRFKQLTNTENVLEILVLDKASTIITVDLISNGMSVSEILRLEKHAVTASGAQSLTEAAEEEEESTYHPCSAFVSSSVSLNEFWLQEEKWVSDLEMIEDRLLMANMFDPVEEVYNGLLCVARFEDGWYRATVLDCSKNQILVRYLDYGNEGITDSIKKIPDDIANILPLSRKCALAKPENIEEWPDKAFDIFAEMAANGVTIFILNILTEGDTNIVELTLNGKDVATEIIQKCMERLPLIGEENSSNVCKVSYVISPSEFWIHKIIEKEKLDYIENCLINDADTYEPVINFEVGKLITAKSIEDNTWYRAKILSHNDNGTEVVYIDYGNIGLIKSNLDMKELQSNLKNIIPMATFCSLKLPEGIESWSKEANDKFLEITTSEYNELNFEIIENEIVKLFYNGQDLVDIIIDNDTTSKSINLNDLTSQFQDLGTKDTNLSKDSAINLDYREPEPVRNLADISENESLELLNSSVSFQDTFNESIQNVEESFSDTIKEINLDDQILNEIINEKQIKAQNNLFTQDTNKQEINEQQEDSPQDIEKTFSYAEAPAEIEILENDEKIIENDEMIVDKNIDKIFNESDKATEILQHVFIDQPINSPPESNFEETNKNDENLSAADIVIIENAEKIIENCEMAVDENIEKILIDSDKAAEILEDVITDQLIEISPDGNCEESNENDQNSIDVKVPNVDNFNKASDHLELLDTGDTSFPVNDFKEIKEKIVHNESLLVTKNENLSEIFVTNEINASLEDKLTVEVESNAETRNQPQVFQSVEPLEDLDHPKTTEKITDTKTNAENRNDPQILESIKPIENLDSPEIFEETTDTNTNGFSTKNEFKISDDEYLVASTTENLESDSVSLDLENQQKDSEIILNAYEITEEIKFPENLDTLSSTNEQIVNIEKEKHESVITSSSKETMIEEVNKPLITKTPHSEKIVPGVVTNIILSESKDEEKID